MDLSYRKVVCYSAAFTDEAAAPYLVVEYVNGRSLAE